MADRLWVYVSDERVGHLDNDQDSFRFQYDLGARTPVSVRLPIREEPYGDSQCRPVFTNLLPEGDWRLAICRQMQIAPENDFALLEAMGKDCAGAIALHPSPDWKPEEGVYRPITEAELKRWVRNPAVRPALRSTPGLRLSLAGAQDKFLIHLEGTQPYLCEGGAPSTWILKPDIADALFKVPLSGLNELLGMRLAAKVGIAAAESSWFASAYASRRFDRELSKGRWRRLHQEDFAQVAGVPAAMKYSIQWKTCFDLIAAEATTPAPARVELLDRLFFSLVLGNNDAHGKNFAFLHDTVAGIRLAPAYDLLGTRIYPALSPQFAMRIGPAAAMEDLSLDAWRAFSREVGIALPFLRERGARMARAMEESVTGLLEEVEAACPALRADIYPARRRQKLFRDMSALIGDNARRVIASLAS